LAYEQGINVSRVLFFRFFTLFSASYIFGRFVRKIDFNLLKYDRNVILIIVFRSLLSMCSKSMQYSAISYIPLSLSSVISFTTGPIFAGILAFVLIGEKLSIVEATTIFFGICGTILITMPELFGIDDPNLSQRLEKDLGKNQNYYLGISLGLISSALDVVTYFIIR
jgi:drug/metabolite transporter (DMT)-like permease